MLNWIYPTKSETSCPKKLIEIKNNKLILDTFDIPDNNEITVYSIVGTARTGKSTLLNCIGSYFLKNNVKIFNIDDTDEHCTIGIDMYYFEEEKIVLLDCQGLKLDDSSNDPKLLLIIYLISDCIIYNQRSILNNDIFETLQPLATFINYIENIIYKPKLIFRILDSELKYEPKKLLEKTMSNKNDQYQNTREAMLSLFSSIDLCITNSLDRNEKKLLQQHKFFDFMLNDENNFMNSIKKILEYKNEKKTFKQWYDLMNKFISSINSNKKIDFNKLDIYQICVEKEMLEFKLSINADNYKNFACGILNDDYNKIVEPKIEYKDNIMNLFHSKFNMASKKIYELHYNDIYEKLESPISNVKKSIIKRTTQQIENEMSIYFVGFEKEHIFKSQDRIITIDSYNEIYTEIVKKIKSFLNTIQKYYLPVVNEYILLLENYIEKINEVFYELLNVQNTNFEYIVNYFGNLKNKCAKVNDIILKTNFQYNFKKYNIKTDYNSFVMELKHKIIENFLIKECVDIFDGWKITQTNTELEYNIYKIYYALNSHLRCEILSLDIKNFAVDTKSIYFFENNPLISILDYSKSKNYIIKQFYELKKLVFENKEIDKIIRTKILQNNLYCIRGVYKKNEKYNKFFDKIGTYINLEFKENEIEKKRLTRKLCLDEFKKYLIKKYKRQITFDKKKIINNLLISEPKITKIYKDFMCKRLLLNNCIEGITLKKKN